MDYDLQAQDFDHTSQDNIGRPLYFNIDMYLCCVEQMIAADEVDRALWMLDNLPGWYRDHVPTKVQKIKEHLYKQLFTTVDYAKCISPTVHYDNNESYLKIHRGREIYNLCRELNEQGIKPHIVEMAPGNYFVPQGLGISGIDFTYFGEGLNINQAYEKKRTDAKVNIFICFEVIEHLNNPSEIYHYSLKHEVDFHFICLSTPKYTWAGGAGDWYNRPLGHLRTYTPKEFLEFAQKHWHGYTWHQSAESELYLMGVKDKS